MTEMQGAVGKAQIKKLDFVVNEQRKNASMIQNAISDFPIEMRTVTKESFETADALVFVESNKIALKCRDELLKAGSGTKFCLKLLHGILQELGIICPN